MSDAFPRNRTASIALAAALLGTAALSPAMAQSVDILPVGNSITDGIFGQCSYRAHLSQTMFRNPRCDAGFVGPSFDADCAAVETFHLGRSGLTARQMVDEFGTGLDIGVAVTTYGPDVVVLHIGSNDAAEGEDIGVTIDRIGLVLTRMLDADPGLTIVLAGIIPWDPTPNENYTHPVFDGDSVDELARTDELATALDVLAGTSGPNVVYVDMRPGFDNATMTIDGVHPNDVGEYLIAERFLGALTDEGFCPPNPLPDLVLETGRWYQIGLPGDPGERNTVGDIFAPVLGAGGIKSTWTLFAHDATDDPQYTELELDDVVEPGRGYWIIQISGAQRTIPMPIGSLPAELVYPSACTGGRGCSVVPFEGPVGVDRRWNMLASPFNTPVELDRARVVTDAGTCGDADGCTLPEAFVGGTPVGGVVSGGTFWDSFYHWDGSAPVQDYVLTSTGEELSPWTGFWALALPDAAGNAPALVFSPD